MFEAVEVYIKTDMEWSSGLETTSAKLPADIIEWQKQDQVAFWKSKALVLELENRMLRQHLKDVYAKSIEDYINEGEIDEEYPVSPTENVYIEKCYEKKVKNYNGSKGNKKKQSYKKGSCEVVSANFPEYTNRSDELKKLYGEKSQKIIGMETALQLNYERHLEKTKAFHWPNLPLNL